MKLLVVDDDDDLRETLAELLEDCGHTVATAADGEAALARLREDPSVEVILLDWMMPRIDGLEFRRRQRADPRLAAIPVVLMSATTAARLPLADIEPDATLRKPIGLAELLEVLAQLA